MSCLWSNVSNNQIPHFQYLTLFLSATHLPDLVGLQNSCIYHLNQTSLTTLTFIELFTFGMPYHQLISLSPMPPSRTNSRNSSGLISSTILTQISPVLTTSSAPVTDAVTCQHELSFTKASSSNTINLT